MHYLIYFDESNKLDQFNADYSYYGAYGGTDASMAKVVKQVRNIFKQCNSFSELHFREYTKDNLVKKYFQTLHTVINENVQINILTVNNKDALYAAQRIGLTTTELRNLFYIKIPERLFYGMTRDLSSQESGMVRVKIKVDQNDEYDKLFLETKIIEQMNAHSAYRNKNYRVVNVLSQNSVKSIPLQIVDTFMGIVIFLLEQNYLESSNTAKIKSDLIYRFLIEGNNLINFQRQIKLYKWTGHEELTSINISDYVSPFMAYKAAYDSQEIIRIQKIMVENPVMSLKELRLKVGYPNTMKNTLIGYKDQIEGRGRNYSIL
ncbi:DUF3800 domain-containing protein [Geobacillus proteiniphilus]|uniref:DUF3800 domain-containing protein n=1 Tax=Geobacillus proteiniphilus TaxID=860353 RepID=A0A1Q5T096_9BACL|nr:DUF3800 domain-containing protein [Geobacillus proteiniphilus]OKO93515.1 hypothetical protein BRO54_1854 [Geobacillus proteiniphilus]WMJ15425.1 DUF3800 domain-containing protein [Geobacillus proteiniphilus]